MLKKIVLAVVILSLILGFSGLALAEEKVEFRELRLTSVRKEPVNVFRYAQYQVDFWAELIRRLVETGELTAVFDKEADFGFEVAVAEEILGRKVDWVAGLTFKEGEQSKFLTGLEYTGLEKFEDGIWQIFQRFRPGLYLVEGKLRWGFSYAFVLK